jgi:hypothetical protein
MKEKSCPEAAFFEVIRKLDLEVCSNYYLFPGKGKGRNFSSFPIKDG